MIIPYRFTREELTEYGKKGIARASSVISARPFRTRPFSMQFYLKPLSFFGSPPELMWFEWSASPNGVFPIEAVFAREDRVRYCSEFNIPLTRIDKGIEVELTPRGLDYDIEIFPSQRLVGIKNPRPAKRDRRELSRENLLNTRPYSL